MLRLGPITGNRYQSSGESSRFAQRRFRANVFGSWLLFGKETGFDMACEHNKSATQQRKLPLLGVVAALLLAAPSAGLAVVGIATGDGPRAAAAYDLFTPASVDPDLAARVADKARERGIRFTPAGANTVRSERLVTVAVRIDDKAAQAISVRKGIETAPGKGSGIAGLQATRFNLGTARGYQSFARQQAATASPSTLSIPSNVRNLSIPDLAEFEPYRPSGENKPSRLQPLIELEDESIAGRSANTLDSIGSQTLGVGGSFRLSPNLDVTAGVRYSQERDRLAPLTNSVQDSQAVYVGTQIKF